MAGGSLEHLLFINGMGVAIIGGGDGGATIGDEVTNIGGESGVVL